MQRLLFVVLGLTVINSVNCVEYTAYAAETKMVVIKKAKTRPAVQHAISTLVEHCPQFADKLNDAMVDIRRCDDEIEQYNEKTSCEIGRETFKKCSKPAVKIVSDCLPPRSKNIPALFITWVESLINHLCSMNGEHIFELVNPCFYKNDEDLNKCELDVHKKFREQHQKTPLNEYDVCALVEGKINCLRAHSNRFCANRVTREAFVNVTDAFYAPCKLLEKKQ